MVSDYRNAIAGAAVTLVVWVVGAFLGVPIPAEVGASAVTLVVFALGFVPRPKPEPVPDEAPAKE